MKSYLIAICSIVIVSFSNKAYSQVNLNQGLIAYYPFDGNAKDASGNNNNPSFNNATLTTDRKGVANKAYYFNGVDNYIQIPNSPTVNAGSQISFSAWIKPMGFYSGPCHGNSVIMKGDGDFLPGSYLLRFDDGLFTNGNNCFTNTVDATHQNFYSNLGGAPPGGYTPYIETDKWYSVVATYDGSMAKLYVNCKLIDSASTPGLTFTNTADLFFGRLNNAQYPYWFNGALDDIRLYNRPLNQDEVNAIGECATQTQVTPAFTVPDTVCINTPVNITNTSKGASTYFWNFCTADINHSPTGTNLAGFGVLNVPVFADIVSDSGNYYAFVTNYGPGELVRLAFGNSMLNTPVATNLGTFGGILPPGSTEGIQVVHNEGKWYAIIVGGSPLAGTSPKIVRIAFGASLNNNTPVATDWGNQGNLDFPHDLNIFEDNGNWYGFAINKEGNTVTRFDFGSSFENTPTATNLGNPPGSNFNLATGIFAIIDDNSNWHVFVVNSYDDGISPPSTGTLTRLDFGKSLANTPTAVNISNSALGNTLHNPRDIYIIKFCGETVGFVVNHATNDIVKLDFNGDLTSTPTATSLGNIGQLNFPHSISRLFRVGADLYCFVPNAANSTITRLKFSGCNNASVPNSVAQNPSAVTYTTPGVYNINLTVDDGLATQNSLCKQVVVLAGPNVKLTKDTTICTGDTALLTASGAASYKWLPTTGLSTPNSASTYANPSITTEYYLTTKNSFGCVSKDSVTVSLSTCTVCSTWLNLSPANSGIRIGDLDIPGNTMTIEANINRTQPYSGGRLYAGDIVSKHTGPPDANYLLRPNSAEITTTTGYYITPPICDIELNKTYHVAMTYDGTTLKFYRNGFLMSQVAATGNLITNNWITTIGTTADLSNTVNTDFIGFINEVRIWNVTRTQDDLKKYMDQSLPNPTSQTGLLAYYTFDNLKNKQGNSVWDGSILNNASINATNSNCSFVADSCGTIPVCNVNPDYSFTQDACSPASIQFHNETTNTSSISWDFGNGKTAGNNPDPSTAYSPYGTYTVKMVVQTTDGCTDSIIKKIPVNAIPDSLIINNDTTLCKKGNLQLSAIPALSYCWSPATGLSATDTAYPVATITKNITYYLNALVTDKNLVVNGDFSQGNTGFSSAYTYTTFNTLEGQYFVGPDPSAWNPSMVNCTDHTSGSGNVLMINGDPQADVKVWAESITVQPNTNYAFSVWIESIFSKKYAENPAQLQFYINGKTIGQIFNGQLESCNWRQFYITWNSGDSTTANISIINKNSQVLGNDFSLDDISFAKTIIKQDSINIQLSSSSLKTSADTSICSGGSVQISASSTGNPTYSWTPASSLDNPSSPTPVASPTATTTYFVQVKNNSGCVNEDSVTVSVLPNPIVATIGDTTICSGTTIQLLTNGNGNSYSWSPAKGLSSASVKNPMATPLTTTKYIVTVNPGSLCFAKDSVNITVNPSPSVTASGDTSICAGSTSQLLATSPNNVSYSWTPSGSLSDATIKNPVASPSSITKYFITVTDNKVCTAIDSIIVNVLPQPLVTTVGDTTICSGTTIQLFTNSNGNNYSWSPAKGLSDASVKNPFATPLTSTKYIVTVNPGSLCFAKDSVNITVNPSPSVKASGDTSICAGSTSQLLATSPNNVSYSWSPSGSLSDGTIKNPVASPTAITKYFIAVTDSKLCTATDSITVDVLPQPFVSTINDTTICSGTTIQLTTSAVNANGFKWSPAKDLSDPLVKDPQATPLATTTYIVTVNPGSQCTAKDSVNITVNTSPSVKASGATSICAGTSTQLSASSPNNVVYSWLPNSGLSDPYINNPLASPSSTTQYFIAVTDNNLCKATDSITVNVSPQPVVTTIADTTICNGSAITLTTTAVNAITYSWSPSTALSDASAQSPLASPSGNTRYVITVNPGDKCIAKDTVNISVNPSPSVQASGDTTLCGGASSQITATSQANVSYSWLPVTGLNDASLSNPVATPAATTTYNVTVTDNNQCTSVASVLVKVNPAPVFAIDPPAAQICIGQPLTLTASGGDIYQWSPPQTVGQPTSSSTQVFPLDNTIYSVTITNSVCKITSTISAAVAVGKKPVVSISKSNDLDCVLAQSQLKATGGTQYTWTPSTGLSNTNVSNPVASPFETTTYYVTIKDINGCEAQDTIQVNVTTNNAENAYMMASAFTPNGDGHNDCFGLKYWGGVKSLQFEVFNRWGNRVFYTTDPSKCWDGTFNGVPQPPGTFIYQIRAATICGSIYRKGTVVLLR